MYLGREGSKALENNPKLSFDKWANAIKGGATGVQGGNNSQRWVYIDGYFVELGEYQDYLDGNSYADTPSYMNERFFRNLNSCGRQLVLLKNIIIGGE